MLHTQTSPTAAQLKHIIAKTEQDKAYRLKTAAFKEWQHKLHPNDQLPRGAFFKNKRAGKPIVIMDEFHRYFERPAHPFPYDPTAALSTTNQTQNA
ncbi:hypothetical protein AB4175_04015 [Vibrio cyclitrophicus]